MQRRAVTIAEVVAALACSLLITASASGQQPTDKGVELPRDPAAWINTTPISADALKGKAALLWFFEEQCPRCRAKWPEMMELSKKYADKPIVFIAVNSGNQRQTIEQYAKECGITWPIVLDPSREFEKACGIDNEISLQNIYQAKMITSSSRLGPGNWSQLEETADRALEGASWNVDPAGIPAPLKSTWLAVEFGNYPAAAPLLKKGLAAANPEIKAASAKLSQVVQAQAAAEIGAAKQTTESGDKWQAYKAFQALSQRYAGYDFLAEVEAQTKTLAEDEKVKQELTAAKALDAVKRAAQTSKTPAAQRGALIRLKKVADDHPGTDAAKEAQAILTQVGSG